MKTLLKFSYIFPLFLFIVHQVSQKILGLEFLFFDFYLDPFCLTALFFPLLKLERKILFGQDKLNLLELLLIFMVLVIVFEGILPFYFKQFVSDFWDVVAMALGTIWFVIFEKKQQA
tara:strand:+ start:165 stop:515 length:351 start_codon:yes stop_codon:yes gene_type:complete